MTLSKTQVSQLYVSLFGRASEGEGNLYWQNDDNSTDMGTAADIMLATYAARIYFGAAFNNSQAFIEHIYLNTLGKRYEEDSGGIDYWVGELNKGKTKGEVVSALITAARHPDNAGAAQDQFNNKVQVSDYAADNLAEYTSFATFSGFINEITDKDATVTAGLAKVDAIINPPSPLPHEDVVLPSNLSLDWVDSTEIISAPHKAIGQVVVTANGLSHIGTGFLISPQHILTNAHVLLNNTGKLDSNAKISFTPGLNGDPSAAKSYDYQKTWVEKNFDTDLYATWPDNDLGIIKLDQPIGDTLGYLKLESKINQNLSGARVQSAGYSANNIEQDNPATPGQDYYQWEVFGTVDKYSFNNSVLKLSDSMAVTAGASGSPIYFYAQNNDTYFTGVLAGLLGDETVAAAMDPDSYNWILGIVQQDGYYADYTLV